MTAMDLGVPGEELSQMPGREVDLVSVRAVEENPNPICRRQFLDSCFRSGRGQALRRNDRAAIRVLYGFYSFEKWTGRFFSFFDLFCRQPGGGRVD
jgi:hypothetical protein